MAKTKLNPLAILDREIPDLAIPEPVDSSGFMRRTHVECISNKDVEEELTVGVVYRVEDITEDNGIYVISDSGNTLQFFNWHFKSIEHGPFKVSDEVQLLNHEDVVIEEKPSGEHVNVPDYVQSKFVVTQAGDTESSIQHKPGVVFRTPNRNLKYSKRFKMLKKNPFRPGDKVKLAKDHKMLVLGCMYTVHAVDNDFVSLKEYLDSGERFRYNVFNKWDRPTRTQLKVRKYKSKMNLSDHVRYYINRKIGDKSSLVSIRKQMIEDKVIGEDISLQDLKKICDTMFTWK